METDGKGVFVRKLGRLLEASRDGQLVLEDVIAARLKRIERDTNGLVSRLYPYTRKTVLDRPVAPTLVTIDAQRAFGRPVISIRKRARSGRGAGRSRSFSERARDRSVGRITGRLGARRPRGADRTARKRADRRVDPATSRLTEQTVPTRNPRCRHLPTSVVRYGKPTSSQGGRRPAASTGRVQLASVYKRPIRVWFGKQRSIPSSSGRNPQSKSSSESCHKPPRVLSMMSGPLSRTNTLGFKREPGAK
jgi:hypothetical protein